MALVTDSEGLKAITTCNGSNSYWIVRGCLDAHGGRRFGGGRQQPGVAAIPDDYSGSLVVPGKFRPIDCRYSGS